MKSFVLFSQRSKWVYAPPAPLHLNIDNKMTCFIINTDCSAHGLRPTDLKCDSKKKKSNTPSPTHPQLIEVKRTNCFEGDERGET